MKLRKKIVAMISVLLIAAMLIPSTCLGSNPDGQNVGTILIPMEISSTDWLRAKDTEAIRLINEMLEEGVPVKWALEEFSLNGKTYPAGTFYIPTPFVTESGMTDAEVYDWLQWQGKKHRVLNMSFTNASVEAASRDLVLPRVVLFYDKTTYENCLEHYNTMTNLGFKVQLCTAEQLIAYDWDDPNSVLANANVFSMPGGSMHFMNFYEETLTKAIENIQGFVNAGGGYVGVCAGSSEALANTSYPYTMLVNASYHEEWFAADSMTEGDWEWRELIGPIYLKIEDDTNPVMFGYGENAKRPGYGKLTTMYYYGGPAMCDLGENTKLLATYDSPVTQKYTDKVANIWGAGAVVTESYGDGDVVVFGPHPEWPGPGKRMYAQALYYCAKNDKESTVVPQSEGAAPDTLDASRVDAIVDTVRESKPILEKMTRSASEMVNLRSGDHYHPLGLWYDESIMAYGQQMYDQLNLLQQDARKFQYEYYRLSLLRDKISDPEVKAEVERSLSMIDEFFRYSENLGDYADLREIPETDWTGCGPYATFGPEYDVKSFSDLPAVFAYLEDEVTNYQYPMAQEYTKKFQAYEEARIRNEREKTEETQAAVDNMYLELTAYEPAGDLYKGMYGLEHTLSVIQFKADNHLLNLKTLANRTEEILSMTNYEVAADVGSGSYGMATVKAMFAYPLGGVL